MGEVALSPAAVARNNFVAACGHDEQLCVQYGPVQADVGVCYINTVSRHFVL